MQYTGVHAVMAINPFGGEVGVFGNANLVIDSILCDSCGGQGCGDICGDACDDTSYCIIL